MRCPINGHHPNRNEPTERMHNSPIFFSFFQRKIWETIWIGPLRFQPPLSQIDFAHLEGCGDDSDPILSRGRLIRNGLTNNPAAISALEPVQPPADLSSIVIPRRTNPC